MSYKRAEELQMQGFYNILHPTEKNKMRTLILKTAHLTLRGIQRVVIVSEEFRQYSEMSKKEISVIPQPPSMSKWENFLFQEGI